VRLRFLVLAVVAIGAVWAGRQLIRREGLSAVRQGLVTAGLLLLGAMVGAASMATIERVRGPELQESVGVVVRVEAGRGDAPSTVCVRDRGEAVLPDVASWCGVLATEMAADVLAGEREAVLGWVQPREGAGRVIVSVRPAS
jgi:hypothetical protein